MRAALFVIGAVAACTGMPDPQPAKNPNQWTTVGKGTLAEVSVERALYEVVGHPHFFIHVRVEDRAPAAIGIDLRQYFAAFYPNQWGASSSLHRGVIDERRMVLGPFDAALEGEVLGSYHDGLLQKATPDVPLDYYIEFNASERAAVDAQAAGLPYVIIVIDGQLRVTDGHTAERIAPGQGNDEREIAIQAPVRWANVPTGATVIRSR